MTKVYNYSLPTLAVFLIAAFMHIIRVRNTELGFMLPLMLLYMAGMTAGAVIYALKKDQFSH